VLGDLTEHLEERPNVLVWVDTPVRPADTRKSDAGGRSVGRYRPDLGVEGLVVVATVVENVRDRPGIEGRVALTELPRRDFVARLRINTARSA
jgi:hypothetical protein